MERPHGEAGVPGAPREHPGGVARQRPQTPRGRAGAPPPLGPREGPSCRARRSSALPADGCPDCGRASPGRPRAIGCADARGGQRPGWMPVSEPRRFPDHRTPFRAPARWRVGNAQHPLLRAWIPQVFPFPVGTARPGRAVPTGPGRIPSRAADRSAPSRACGRRWRTGRRDRWGGRPARATSSEYTASWRGIGAERAPLGLPRAPDGMTVIVRRSRADSSSGAGPAGPEAVRALRKTGSRSGRPPCQTPGAGRRGTLGLWPPRGA
jgi:hypothetical protein